MSVMGRLNQQVFEVISNYLSINLSSWLNCLCDLKQELLNLLGILSHYPIPPNEADNCIREETICNPWKKFSLHCTWEKIKHGFLLRTMTPLQDSDWIWGHNMSPGLDWNSGSSKGLNRHCPINGESMLLGTQRCFCRMQNHSPG